MQKQLIFVALEETDAECVAGQDKSFEKQEVMSVKLLGEEKNPTLFWICRQTLQLLNASIQN